MSHFWYNTPHADGKQRFKRIHGLKARFSRLGGMWPLAGTVPSLNYWCTWAIQGMTRRLPEWHRKVAAIVGEKGIAGAGYAGNYIFDELVYGPKGWSKSMFPKPLNGVGFPKSRACTGAGRIFGQVDFERKDWRGTDSTNNIVK